MFLCELARGGRSWLLALVMDHRSRELNIFHPAIFHSCERQMMFGRRGSYWEERELLAACLLVSGSSAPHRVKSGLQNAERERGQGLRRQSRERGKGFRSHPA